MVSLSAAAVTKLSILRETHSDVAAKLSAKISRFWRITSSIIQPPPEPGAAVWDHFMPCAACSIRSKNAPPAEIERRERQCWHTACADMCDPEDGKVIGCDSCGRWFHYSCVELDEVDLPDTYQCPACWTPPTYNHPVPPGKDTQDMASQTEDTTLVGVPTGIQVPQVKYVLMSKPDAAVAHLLQGGAAPTAAPTVAPIPEMDKENVAPVPESSEEDRAVGCDLLMELEVTPRRPLGASRGANNIAIDNPLVPLEWTPFQDHAPLVPRQQAPFPSHFSLFFVLFFNSIDPDAVCAAGDSKEN